MAKTSIPHHGERYDLYGAAQTPEALPYDVFTDGSQTPESHQAEPPTEDWPIEIPVGDPNSPLARYLRATTPRNGASGEYR